MSIMSPNRQQLYRATSTEMLASRCCGNGKPLCAYAYEVEVV